MTNLEHLIENTLCSLEDGKSYEEVMESINSDINLADSGITAEQCWEICQYVYYSYCPDRIEESARPKYEKSTKSQMRRISEQTGEVGFSCDYVCPFCGSAKVVYNISTDYNTCLDCNESWRANESRGK